MTHCITDFAFFIILNIIIWLAKKRSRRASQNLWPPFSLSLFLRQYELSGRRSSRGRCTASSTPSRSRRSRTTAASRRSRWRRVGWSDVPSSRGTALDAPARDAAPCASLVARIRWTASWTTRRTCTPTRVRVPASVAWRIRTSALYRRVTASTTTGSRSAGTANATFPSTGTGNRRRSTWQCRRRSCGHRHRHRIRTPPTITRTHRPASPLARARLEATGTSSTRSPARRGTSPTIGSLRPPASWAGCSGRARAIPRSSRPARRVWTARTWRSSTAIGRPALGPATVIITASGRRRKCRIAPTSSGRASDSLSSADRPLIRTR